MKIHWKSSTAELNRQKKESVNMNTGYLKLLSLKNTEEKE